MSIESLNQTHGIEGSLHFVEGFGGLPKAVISTPNSTAELYIHGGHVTHFQPNRHDPVLFVSEEAQFRDGKAIRGGIPVIWPWFGSHPTNSDLPSHGFARRMSWQFREASVGESGDVYVRLALLESSNHVHPMFPYAFKLELRVRVSDVLEVDLYARNMGETPFTYTAALHSYFEVGSVSDITLIGLEEKPYLDQLDKMTRRIQQKPIQIDREVDRIYLKTADSIFIHDPNKRRIINVAKEGSRSTVIWNPWIDKSQRLQDFGDKEYKQMVCVETANIQDDAVTLDAYQGHHLKTIIAVESIF